MDLDHAACFRAISTRDARFDGLFFTGVKTTGIYCRPICPARTPRAVNVLFFATAAAAQAAGFRPCLRCRPEIAPDLAASHGTSSTVCRALSLIEMGALDEGDVEALAARLGVGERHLRRLFREQVGAAPAAVAQTRRILLAKRLIHDTHLPMSDVAMAAGFGSIRRFNQVFQQLYRRSPQALRRGAPREEPGSGRELSLLLPYRAPYDWDSMLGFFAARAIPGMEAVRGNTYARTIQVAGAQGMLTVRPGRGASLQATLVFPRLDALPTIIARIRRVFDLMADPDAIGLHLSEDPHLARLVARRPGLRVPGAWDGFELAVRAVLGQQITVAGAKGLAGKLVAAYGAPLRMAPAQAAGLTHLFPDPERLAGADLATLGMPRQRALTLSAVAAAVVADPDIFGPRRSLEEAIAQLRNLPGIGEWTAQYIALRQMREPDAFPASDVGLMRAMTGGDGRRPGAEALLAMAERWRPWRAYAAQHLWATAAEAAAAPAGPLRLPPVSAVAHSEPVRGRTAGPPG
jgi:AraC family transcriptional regulator of adaptative response / DNA-3-methyladenine glycosylase II